ncbi:flagellar motor protein MotB [Bacillus methanolicus]|uniref:Motility protein B n=1 Tax=Bacillus methanolicus (strain MGA3 / ATCC 53907) TaxID=796606 RepID=I3E2S0_BACMM|nr:flagellar motor protein MotB [Bacillus methanolicus]AIE59109.1 Motility protein B [Bacillus methanolicus MGA3]EIJ80791.1 flagellar motor protein MotB [Bacillus methanolicus MGA3]UQD51187.1 flagellar motor protein MotB [Bacillus methanolicus]
MSKRKKKYDQEDHIDETWLIPYSDLLTLLLALFIVLFSMSSVDAQKFRIFSKAFNDIFTGGTGVTEFQSPMPEGQMESPDERKKDKEKAENQSAQNVDKQELQKIQNKITAYIKETHLTDKLNTSLTDEGLLVTIRDNVLFDSGSAEVRKEDVKIAKEISDLLVIDPPRNIIISGHTDNVPIHTAKFESNWELSVMRAVNFMKIILENDKLDPRWFSAKGYGEYKPVASNATKEGRAKNRRVEILILPRTGG